MVRLVVLLIVLVDSIVVVVVAGVEVEKVLVGDGGGGGGGRVVIVVDLVTATDVDDAVGFEKLLVVSTALLVEGLSSLSSRTFLKSFLNCVHEEFGK